MIGLPPGGHHPSRQDQHPNLRMMAHIVQKHNEKSRKHPPGREAPRRGAAEGRAYVFLTVRTIFAHLGQHPSF